MAVVESGQARDDLALAIEMTLLAAIAERIQSVVDGIASGVFDAHQTLRIVIAISLTGLIRKSRRDHQTTLVISDTRFGTGHAVADDPSTRIVCVACLDTVDIQHSQHSAVGIVRRVTGHMAERIGHLEQVAAGNVVIVMRNIGELGARPVDTFQQAIARVARVVLTEIVIGGDRSRATGQQLFLTALLEHATPVLIARTPQQLASSVT